MTHTKGKNMKRLVITIVSTASIAMMAQEQPMAQEKPMDDETKATVRRQIIMRCRAHEKQGPLADFVRGVAHNHGISHEQMAGVLEELILEKLPVVGPPPEEETRETRDHTVNFFDLANSIGMLTVVQGTNTLAVLKECTLSKNRNIRYNAVRVYVSIAGAESIPFLRETLAAGRISNLSSYAFEELLQKTADSLEEKGQSADAKKIRDFLPEARQAEYPIAVPRPE